MKRHLFNFFVVTTICYTSIIILAFMCESKNNKVEIETETSIISLATNPVATTKDIVTLNSEEITSEVEETTTTQLEDETETTIVEQYDCVEDETMLVETETIMVEQYDNCVEDETIPVEVETETIIVEQYNSYEYDSYGFDDYDYQMMWQCIETEVFEQSFEIKCNIASVILNRVKNYGCSPAEVVTSPYQFAYFRTNISDDTKQALKYVLENGDTTNGCMAFRSDCCPYTWYDWTYQFFDGSEYYYK